MNVSAVLASLALVLAANAAQAQGIDAGRAVAERVCAECHAVAGPGPSPGSGSAPPFAAIAALPSTTELSLRAFLQMPHDKMPNLMLSPGDTANVIAYIMSLRSR